MLLKTSIICLFLGISEVLASPLDGVKAHSQRAVSVYTPDDAEGNSQIIRLQLQPHSQHSRHLDSNTASINGIPQEFNEIPNTDNIPLDSYGNPVTPFGDMSGPIDLDPIGFDEQKAIQSGAWEFKLPSYASGVIDTYSHVPPLGRNINFEDFSTPTPLPPAPTQEPIQFLKKFNPDEAGTGPILFSDKPSDGLLPPLFPNEQGPIETAPTVQSPPHHSPPTFRPSTGIAEPSVYPSIASTPQIHSNGNIGAQSHYHNSQQPNIANSEAKRFSGTFGGSSGFLGSQNKPGYAVKPDGTLVSPTGNIGGNTGSTIIHETVSTIPQPALPTQQTVNKFTGSFGGSQGVFGQQSKPGHAQSVQHQITDNKFTTQHPIQITPPVNKFGGSFGGSQGVLGQQSTPGHAAGSHIQSGSTGHSSQNYHQVVTQQPFVATTSGNKFTGSFGGSAASYGQQQKPGYAIKPDGSIASPQLQTNNYNGNFGGSAVSKQPQNAPSGNKFTGLFGGSQGVLGQQAKPGYAVKPDGGIVSSTGSQSQGNKYAGSFGGSAPDYQQNVGIHKQNTNHAAQTPQANRFAGSFGGSSTNYQQVDSATFQSQKGSKFTGHFGGAPGILGQQNFPGSAVKSDGTISQRGFSAGPQHSGAAAQVHSYQNSGVKYTGSFNGPPGILKPYDNLGVKTG